MRQFIKKLLFIVFVAVIFYILYLYPGSIVITWYNYQLVSTILALVVAIVGVLILLGIFKYINKIIYNIFSKINLNDTLADYIKYLELTSQFDKEIHLKLITEIENLKTLKFFVRLNELLKRKQYNRVQKLIKAKSNNPKLKNLLNFANIQIMLASNQIKEAADACRVYLSAKNKPAWAFLKLLEISLTYTKDDIIQFKFLNALIINKQIELSKTNVDKAYCLINYQIAALEYKSNPEQSFNTLISLVKRYPNFIPGYNLLLQYLLLQNKYKEIKEYIIKSWQYDISYENTILWEPYLQNEPQLINSKEIQRLLKDNKLDQNKKLLLQTALHITSNKYLEAREDLQQITDTNTEIYKLVNLYITVKENNITNYQAMIKSFLSSLKLNWWNDYISL
ncbi:hypothetical protein ACFX5K_04310 [Rickettsiales bacterium LUAb2]